MTNQAETKLRKRINATADVVMRVLGELVRTGRFLHQSRVSELGDALIEPNQVMQKLTDRLLFEDWPARYEAVGETLLEASAQIKTMLSDFRGAARSPEKIWEQRLALRGISLVESMLYPYAGHLEAVHDWFLEPDAAMRPAPPPAAASGLRVLGPATGIQQLGEAVSKRGVAAFYVPEYYQDNQNWPLIIALHGASGRGQDYLFAWLKVAKSRGAMVLAPTSIGATWSMLGQEGIDAAQLAHLLEQIKSQYRIDERRILLTGLSDGAIYSWLLGAQEAIGATHLAVLSGTLHPLMAEPDHTRRLLSKPIYLLHGHLDELFPYQEAEASAAFLEALGMNVTYRGVPDLGHTVAREEHAAIMDWFGCPLASSIG